MTIVLFLLSIENNIVAKKNRKWSHDNIFFGQQYFLVAGILSFKWICLMLVLRAQDSRIIIVIMMIKTILLDKVMKKLTSQKSLEYLVSCIPANKWHQTKHCCLFKQVHCPNHHGSNAKIRKKVEVMQERYTRYLFTLRAPTQFLWGRQLHDV